MLGTGYIYTHDGVRKAAGKLSALCGGTARMRFAAAAVAAVLCALLCSTAVAPAAWADTAASSASNPGLHVVVYTDGTMSFQIGSRPLGGKRVATDAQGRKADYTGVQEAFYTKKKKAPWASLAPKVKRVVFKCTFITRHTTWWFYNFKRLRTIDLSALRLGNGGYTSNMFKGCASLVSADFSGLKKKWRPFNMACMFDGCRKLETVKGINAKIDTRVTSALQGMFRNCAALTSLSLSKWQGSKWTRKLGSMFKGCSSLSSLNLAHLRAEEALDMSHMFDGCTSLSSLKLSSFEVPQDIRVAGAFKSCSALKSLSLWWQSAFLPERCAVLKTAQQEGRLTISSYGDGEFVVRDEPYALSGKPSSKKVAASVRKL